MFSLFGPRLPIDDEELEFQLATFKWLGLEFGKPAEALVLPTPHWFPRSSKKGHARVKELFDQTRTAASMSDWACDLRPGETSRSIEAGNSLLLKHEGPEAPCGTFQTGEDGRAVITYNPAMEGDPAGLVATFAHELGHYLIATAKSDPPGGWELHELHTDIAAVYLGFGIFLSNTARNFTQFQSASEAGWQMRRQGYLSEGALVTALVVAERLGGREPLACAGYLKDYLRKDLKNAAGALARRHPDIQGAIEAVDLAEYGSGED